MSIETPRCIYVCVLSWSHSFGCRSLKKDWVVSLGNLLTFKSLLSLNLCPLLRPVSLSRQSEDISCRSVVGIDIQWPSVSIRESGLNFMILRREINLLTDALGRTMQNGKKATKVLSLLSCHANHPCSELRDHFLCETNFHATVFALVVTCKENSINKTLVGIIPKLWHEFSSSLSTVTDHKGLGDKQTWNLIVWPWRSHLISPGSQNDDNPFPLGVL